MLSVSGAGSAELSDGRLESVSSLTSVDIKREKMTTKTVGRARAGHVKWSCKRRDLGGPDRLDAFAVRVTSESALCYPLGQTGEL